MPAAALLTLIGGTAAIASPVEGGLAHGGSAHAPLAKSVNLTWHSFELINGWQSASKKLLKTGKPGWAIRNGVVYLRGAIKQPVVNGNATFAQLPKFARPARNLYIQVFTTGDVAGSLFVGSDGVLEAYNGNSFTFTSLAGVSFPTAAIKSHKLALKNGWQSSQSRYGTGDPSYSISHGVVYLSGSLQTAGSSQLATVLPKAARPNRQMFVSIYTFGGSTGWLQILHSGQVNVFGNQSGEYTSLANISFPVGGTKWHNFNLVDGWKSGQANFHTATPAYAVIDGVVYLDGSMFEVKDSVGFWTVLPSAVRTAGDVLNIEVFTTLGTVGAVAITSSFGLVNSMPFNNAQALTSLAAIAYPQGS